MKGLRESSISGASMTSRHETTEVKKSKSLDTINPCALYVECAKASSLNRQTTPRDT